MTLTFSGRWIPVTERLPDDDIIVMLHQPDTGEAWILGSRDGEDWRTQDGCWIIYGVTHWADLPAGPQGCGTDGVKTGAPRGPVHSCKNCAHLAKGSCDEPCAGCTVRWRSGVSDRWEPAYGVKTGEPRRTDLSKPCPFCSCAARYICGHYICGHYRTAGVPEPKTTDGETR